MSTYISGYNNRKQTKIFEVIFPVMNSKFFVGVSMKEWSVRTFLTEMTVNLVWMLIVLTDFFSVWVFLIYVLSACIQYLKMCCKTSYTAQTPAV